MNEAETRGRRFSNVVIEDGVHAEVFIIDYFFDGPGFHRKDHTSGILLEH